MILTSVAAISATTAAAMAGSVTAMATIAVNVGLAVGVVGATLNVVGRITRDKGLQEAGAQMGMAGGALGLAGGATNYAIGTGAEQAVGKAAESGADVVADQTATVATTPDVSGATGQDALQGGTGADTLTEPATQAVDQTQQLGGAHLGEQQPTVDPTVHEGESILGAPGGPAAPQAPAPLAAPTAPQAPTTADISGGTGDTTLGGSVSADNLTKPYGMTFADWQKIVAAQGIAGLGSGMMQSMSASDKIDLEKRINAQRQAQVEYKNQNAAYAPKVMFKPTGLMAKR